MESAPRLRVLSSIAEVSALQWNALLDEDPVPALRWEWLDALERSGSASEATGWKPHHLTLWEGPTLVAASPAYLKFHSMGEYIYDFGWAQAAEAMGVAYYPKLLVGVPLSPLTGRRFLSVPRADPGPLRQQLIAGALAEAQTHQCSSLHVLFPTSEETRALEAEGFARRTTLQYHWQNAGYDSYEAFLSRFDAKRRHQLRRERKAASEQGIRLRTVRGPELDASHAELAFRFYENTCLKNVWGRVQLNRDFFQRAFAAMPDAIELVLAERHGQVVAGAFNLTRRHRLYGRYWGCFEEHPFLHFHVCLYHSIDECIQSGREAFEPGAGGEHKISRGFEPTEIHSAHWIFSPRLDRAIRAALDRERAHLRPVLEQAIQLTGMRPWPQR